MDASRRIATALACAAAVLSAIVADAADTRKVGRQSDGSVVLPTNQELRPAGNHVEFGGRPNAVAVRPDSQTAALLTDQAPPITIIDVRGGAVVQRFDPQLGDASFNGLAYSRDGRRLYASLSKNKLLVTGVAPDGSLLLVKAIDTKTLPGGFALSRDERRAYVAFGKKNALGVVDLARGRVVSEIDVGNAPHSVVLSGGYAVVSNRGGRRARAGDPTNLSAKTPIVSTRKSGGAATGTVSIVDLARQRVVAEVAVGLHPSNMAVRGRYVFVANSNSDTVSVVDVPARRVVSTIAVKPYAGAPFGSSPNAVAVVDGSRLAVSLGRNNAVALYRWTSPSSGARLDGLIPTGWYPSDVAVDRRTKRLLIANNKGVGSLQADTGAGDSLVGIGAGGTRASYNRGSASIVDLPGTATLQTYTQTVVRNNRWDRLLPALRGSPDAPPRAIPDRLGDPSHIKHVFLIIKENRTYDQVLGDLPTGNGDPTKVQFGAAVTPNQHLLATQFPLLDNFYVLGTVSADAHHWLVQSFATDYVEEQFGDFSRGNPFDGGDALAYAPTGFIWEHVQRHGRSVKVYGEFADHRDGTGTRSDIPSLDRVLHRAYPRFDLNITDRERAAIFVEEFERQAAADRVPALSIIQLPLDHTRGLTPGATAPTTDVADNDHATGLIVEAISKSRVWGRSAVFVVEDDAQAGIDHVDGHRTMMFVASPYAKRSYVDSTYYTQIDMIRTIEQILGVPPMTQADALGTPMRSLFMETPDTTPFHAVAPAVPQVQNPPLASLTGMARLWAEACARIDFTHPDAAPEQLLNRAIWYAVNGFVPYPGDPRVLRPDETLALPDPD